MLMECKAVVFIPSICSPFFYVSLTIFLIRGKTPLPSYKFMSFGGVAPSRFQKWASEPDFIDRDMSYPYHSFWSRNRYMIQEGSMKMNPRTLTGMTPKRHSGSMRLCAIRMRQTWRCQRPWDDVNPGRGKLRDEERTS